MLECDKCGGGINEGSKFCPQCGDPVTEADRVSTPATESKIANVGLSFGYSSSANYGKAVEICKNIPSYSVEGEEKNLKHKVTLPITEVDLIANLFDLVGSWKSSKMLINGHVATKKDLTYYGVGCYRNRQKAYNPKQYCFGEREFEANIWGCKRLNMPVNEWGGGWLDYGKFDDQGVWYFDKDRIKHELEIKLKENDLCPVLDRKKVLETLENLPDSINPKKDKNWKYKTSYEDVSGDFKEVAVGIRPVLNKVNRYIIGSFKPAWESSSEHGQSATVATLHVQLGEEAPKAKKGLEQSKKGGASSAVWWVVGILLILAVFVSLGNP